MRLTHFTIDNFRSVEHAELNFPTNAPVVLFGPNNVGKSNILRALDCMLGEKYAPNYDFQDSDYYLRDPEKFPNISFQALFDENFYRGNKYNPSTKTICFSTNKNVQGKNENAFHYSNEENGGNKIFLGNDDRESCQFILIDATRDINRQLSYFSQYSILSKMANKMHKVLQKSVRDKLTDSFNEIKNIFESVPEYKVFYDKLQEAFESNVDGFEHKLEIDLSAYDPNNYFHSLRISPKEGESTRSFDELGTGEQQVLLISFVKAYAETFKGESFILGIEEPEAHLHPIAQRWLSKNISNLSKGKLQIIVTTHSPEFLDIENLEGFIRVYKEKGNTKSLQHTAKSLAESCIELKSDQEKTKETSILGFYKTKSFYDQLRGFFARKILLVEGSTEYFSLPKYFENSDYDLIKNGVEIINCHGKSQIARNYRLFKSFGYECFCLFDADTNKGEKPNTEFARVFEFKEEEMILEDNNFYCDKNLKFGYFGKNFECYMRKNIKSYADLESSIQDDKVMKAKTIAEENSSFKPEFILLIAQALNLEANKKIKVADIKKEPTTSEVEVENNTPAKILVPDDIPF